MAMERESSPPRTVDPRQVYPSATRFEVFTEGYLQAVWLLLKLGVLVLVGYGFLLYLTGHVLATVPIAGLKLPRLDRLAVAIGDADDVVTPESASDQAAGIKPKRRLPVPVVPKAC